jgi:hypothetical protein
MYSAVFTRVMYQLKKMSVGKMHWMYMGKKIVRNCPVEF